MSKPTSETPPERPNDTSSNQQDSNVCQRADTTPTDSDVPAVEEVKVKPTTDVSLISGDNKPRKYKTDNQSFLCSAAIKYCLCLDSLRRFS